PNVPFFSSSEYSIFSYLSNSVLLTSPFADLKLEFVKLKMKLKEIKNSTLIKSGISNPMALYDFQSILVPTFSGLGMDRDCSNWSHDYPHKSFSKNKLVEDIVGALISLPLIFSYEPWLYEDIAWHPVWKDEFDSSPHFDLKKFRTNEIKRVKISLACVFAFMAIGWPLIIYKTGIMRWIKFWFMPWLDNFTLHLKFDIWLYHWSLFLTYLGLYLMKGHGQLALLYLVPCTLGIVLKMARLIKNGSLREQKSSAEPVSKAPSKIFNCFEKDFY
ncbi:hypothetical protein S83_016462, partial [Arachis hypogaea]